jgi:hypothetical protein
MVVACLALTVSLSGTGYAALKLAPNSVGARELRSGSVGSSEVKNFSLRRGDFARGQLPAGPQGPPGPQGVAGPAGPAGTIGTITVRTGSVGVDSGSPPNGQYATRSVQVLCSTGEKAISATTSWSDDNNDLELVTVGIRPVLDATNNVVGYTGRGGNDSGQSSNFTLHVLCYR